VWSREPRDDLPGLILSLPAGLDVYLSMLSILDSSIQSRVEIHH
jgi:hypothetical protein